MLSPLRKCIDDTNRSTDFKGKVQILIKRIFFPSLGSGSWRYSHRSVSYLITIDHGYGIRRSEVAIRPQPDKAPGINKIPSRILTQVLEVLLPHFTHLFQSCVNSGYHSKEFRIANTIVLKKPRKEDYLLAESYRPIALLNMLGKALETIFARRLSGLAEANNLLPSQQVGARRNRSIE